jgi:hypothetical protein
MAAGPMQPRTPIFIVTSSRPRVGKTLIARALVEYFLAQKRPVDAFDVNSDEFTLLEYLPSYTAAASLRDTRGEMALFDRLIVPDDAAKVIDLAHHQLERFFTVLQQVNFMVEARRRGVVPIVLFIADADERARAGYVMLCQRFPDCALVPVLNEVLPQIERYRNLFPPSRRGSTALNVPALSPVVRSIVDRRGFSFIDYAAKVTDTTAELYLWMRCVFLSFRAIELRAMLDDTPPALRRSA